MLRYLKANMGIDQSPLAAAMKLAHQPRSNMAETAGPMVRTLPQSVMNAEGHSIGRGALPAMHSAATESL